MSLIVSQVILAGVKIVLFHTKEDLGVPEQNQFHRVTNDKRVPRTNYSFRAITFDTTDPWLISFFHTGNA